MREWMPGDTHTFTLLQQKHRIVTGNIISSGLPFHKVVLFDDTVQSWQKPYLFSYSHGRGIHIESPFDKGWWQNIVDFIGWRVSGILKPSRQNWISTFDVESKKFDKVSCCDDKEPLLGSSNGIVWN